MLFLFAALLYFEFMVKSAWDLNLWGGKWGGEGEGGGLFVCLFFLTLAEAQLKKLLL